MTTSTASCLSIPDPLTGEVRSYAESRPGVYVEVPDSLLLAARRWRLKYHVREILGPTSRQAKCHRWRVPKKEIEIQRSLEHSGTFFSGLEVCGSVWLCPLCAAKISERRSRELESAINRARELGYWIQLLTLTFPHGMGDVLGGKEGMVDRMTKAYTHKMLSGRTGKDLRLSLNFVGTIRAIEVTYGKNGWHPHLHILVISQNRSSLVFQESIWRTAWLRACIKAGLPLPSETHGCTLQNGDAAALYVSKWGLAQELTKSHLKKGKEKGASPWDLLAIASGESWDDMPDYPSDTARRLWCTYAAAFKGRRQLCWSKGLKDLLSVVDTTDEELATEDLDTAALLYTLTDIEWSWIIAARAECDVLSVARDCPEALQDFIADLRPRSLQGDREWREVRVARDQATSTLRNI